MRPIRKKEGMLRFINIRSICGFFVTLPTRFTSRALSTKHSEIAAVAIPFRAYLAGKFA